MTIALAILAVAVVLLTVLVAGLLQSHARILRQLHELGAGVDEVRPPRDGGGATGAAAPTPARTGRTPAHDVAGTGLDGDPLALAVTGVGHDTLLLFLSSGCTTCEGYWEQLREGGVTVPEGTRLVIVAQDAVEESPARLDELAPPEVTLVLSSDAWRAYAVPGSPYAVHVDGGSGTVVGQGTGASWEQVARLMARATGDLGYVATATGSSRRARPDLRREQDVDRALLEAGITPGDDRLYQPLDRTPEPS